MRAANSESGIKEREEIKRLREKSHSLQGFFSLLYHPGERIYLYAIWNNRGHIGEGLMLPRPRNGFIASAKLGSQRFHLAVRKADKYNRNGYDIFSTPNPLSHSRRMQLTVGEIRYLVIEADHIPLERQRTFLEMIKDKIRVAVFTGHRSIHCYLPLEPPIPNNGYIQPRDWKRALTYNPRIDPGVENPEFESKLKDVKKFLRSYDYPFCIHTLSNFATLTRTPFFKHQETQKEAQVIYVNNQQQKYSPEQHEEHEPHEKHEEHEEHEVDFLGFNIIQLSKKALEKWNENSENNENNENNENDGKPDVYKSSTSTISKTPVDSEITGIADNELKEPDELNELEKPDVYKSEQNQSVEYSREPGENAVESNRGRSRIQYKSMVASFEFPRRTFLDDLRIYAYLKTFGIPSKGTRLICQKTLFRVATIFDWDDETLIGEWQKVIYIAPENMRADIEYALEDFKNAWERVKERDRGFQIWLPDQSSLPDLDNPRAKYLKTRLKEMGCEKSTSVRNIIVKNLYPAIRKSIPACRRGTASIRTKDMRKACNNYGYKYARKWMEEKKILILRDAGYKIGFRSRKYFINVPWILFLLGFETEDLTWESGKTDVAGSQKASGTELCALTNVLINSGRGICLPNF